MFCFLWLFILLYIRYTSIPVTLYNSLSPYEQPEYYDIVGQGLFTYEPFSFLFIIFFRCNSELPLQHSNIMNIINILFDNRWDWFISIYIFYCFFYHFRGCPVFFNSSYQWNYCSIQKPFFLKINSTFKWCMNYLQ